MNITQNENNIVITSTENSSYSYVHVIQDVSTLDTTIINNTFTNSTSTYNFTTDGYFIITELKLPKGISLYYYYILNGVIYNLSDEVVTVEELMNMDPDEIPGLIREDLDYLSLYLLREYYLNLLKSKYLKNICNCGCACIDRIDKVKLDTLTMGLDLIEALESKFQYYEIQRIVEKLSSCFGIITSNCNCK